MTKKDYEMIALIINDARVEVPGLGYTPTEIVTYILEGLTLAFMEDNPRFNAETFRKACGF